MNDFQNMTQGERLRYLRKTLGLTLEKFGEKLGVGKTAISKLEKNERGLTDQMLKSICREYSVREEWLRDGVGKPFSDSHAISFVNTVMSEGDCFKKRVLDVLAELNDSEWAVLEHIALRIKEKDGI